MEGVKPLQLNIMRQFEFKVFDIDEVKMEEEKCKTSKLYNSTMWIGDGDEGFFRGRSSHCRWHEGKSQCPWSFWTFW